MNTRKVATELRLTQWAQMIQGRRESGQSIEAYCQAVGVSRNTYFYWQRKLREAACEELGSRISREVSPCEKALIPDGWAVCKSAEPVAMGKPVAIEIGGFRVIAEAESDPGILVKVCRALKSLC